MKKIVIFIFLILLIIPVYFIYVNPINVADENNITYVHWEGIDSSIFSERNVKHIIFNNILDSKINNIHDDAFIKSGDTKIYLLDDTLYIDFSGILRFNPNSSGLLGGFNKVETIEGFEYVNTSDVTDMSGMFACCFALKKLDLSGFDTSKVKNMNNMFFMCSRLLEININSFDTSKVTDMSGMFYQCYDLKYLNLINFDTQNVIDMRSMFRECKNITRIFVGDKWDINKVKNSNYIFSDCMLLVGGNGTTYNNTRDNIKYAVIDNKNSVGLLSDCNGKFTWNGCDSTIYQNSTIKHLVFNNILRTGIIHQSVPDYSYGDVNIYFIGDTVYFDYLGMLSFSRICENGKIFSNCKYIETIEGLEYVDTSQIIYFNKMFYGCTNLYELNLNNWKTNIALSMESMFEGCENLKKIELGNWNTSKVTNMHSMFSNCLKLEELDISKFNTSNVTNMNSMFANCKSLLQLDVSNFETHNVIKMETMFYNCENLLNLDVSNFNTELVTTMVGMFQGCKKLSSLKLQSFNVSKIESISKMFYNCESLVSLDLSNFEFKKLKDASSVFSECYKLEEIKLWKNGIGESLSLKSMFKNCSSLLNINIENWNTSHVLNMSSMFDGCEKLKKIYVGRGWSTALSSVTENMFKNCFNLVGGNGTIYNGAYIDKSYANIDSKDNPGYFSINYSLSSDIYVIDDENIYYNNIFSLDNINYKNVTLNVINNKLLVKFNDILIKEFNLIKKDNFIDDYIFKINYKDSNINKILEFTALTDISYEIVDIKGNKVLNDKLATGYIVRISDGITTEEHVICMAGDSNGDGMISALDYINIKNHIMETKYITGDVYLDASDVNGDGIISALDYITIKNMIMNGEV